MPQKAWSAKRERQYEHIKSGLRERGESEDTAEEIAAHCQQGAGTSRRSQGVQPQFDRRHLIRSSRRASLAQRTGRSDA